MIRIEKNMMIIPVNAIDFILECPPLFDPKSGGHTKPLTTPPAAYLNR